MYTANDFRQVLIDDLALSFPKVELIGNHSKPLEEAITNYKDAWSGLLPRSILNYRVSILKACCSEQACIDFAQADFPDAESILRKLQHWNSLLGRCFGLMGIDLPDYWLPSLEVQREYNYLEVLAAIFNYASSTRHRYPFMRILDSYIDSSFDPSILVEREDNHISLFPVLQPWPTIDNLAVKDVSIMTLAGMPPIGAVHPFYQEPFDLCEPIWSPKDFKILQVVESLDEFFDSLLVYTSGTLEFTRHDCSHFSFLGYITNNYLNSSPFPLLDGIRGLTLNGILLKQIFHSPRGVTSVNSIEEKLLWSAIFMIAHENGRIFMDGWNRDSLDEIELKSCLSSRFGIGSILTPIERLRVRLGLEDTRLKDVLERVYESCSGINHLEIIQSFST